MNRHVIKSYLDLYLTGQDEAKDELSFLAELYLKRLNLVNDPLNRVDLLPKQNMLLIGRSGSGKSYLAKTLADSLGLPYHRIDMSTVTGEGWKGANFSDYIWQYVRKTEQFTGAGILHLDEFDKVILGDSAQKMAVQLALIDLLDLRYTAKVEDKPNVELDDVNNTFIIMSGSFEHANIYGNSKSNIGFVAANSSQMPGVVPDEFKAKLLELGYLPELVNRIVTIQALQPYTFDELCSILSSEVGILKQYQKLYEGELYIADYELTQLARKCYDSKEGLRSLSNEAFRLVQSKMGIPNKVKLKC